MLIGAIVKVLEPNRVYRASHSFVQAFSDRSSEYEASYTPPEGALGILIFQGNGLERKSIVALDDGHTIVIASRYLEEVTSHTGPRIVGSMRVPTSEELAGSTLSEVLRHSDRLAQVVQSVQRFIGAYNSVSDYDYGQDLTQDQAPSEE